MSERKEAALAVIVIDGAVLMLTNRRDGGFAFPGGRCEGEETPRETLIREMREELGAEMTPTDLAFLGAFPGTREGWTCHLFYVNEIPGYYAAEEGTELRWSNLAECVALAPPGFGEFYSRVFPDGFDHLKTTQVHR